MLTTVVSSVAPLTPSVVSILPRYLSTTIFSSPVSPLYKPRDSERADGNSFTTFAEYRIRAIQSGPFLRSQAKASETDLSEFNSNFARFGSLARTFAYKEPEHELESRL